MMIPQGQCQGMAGIMGCSRRDRCWHVEITAARLCMNNVAKALAFHCGWCRQNGVLNRTVHSCLVALVALLGSLLRQCDAC